MEIADCGLSVEEACVPCEGLVTFLGCILAPYGRLLENAPTPQVKRNDG